MLLQELNGPGVKAGVFRRIIEELAADLQERLREAFIDSGKKRVAGQNAAKAAESWQLRMLPVLASASPHEVKLVETVLVQQPAGKTYWRQGV